jgi:alanyl-tRNA synthetase
MPDRLTSGGLRVVEIAGFDRTACGGTHVARTGEIGMIKVLKLERRGDETRVEFRCGWRALHDLRGKNTTVNQLAAELTVGHWEITQAVDRLRGDLKSARQALKAANARLLEYEADALRQAAAERNGVRVVVDACADRDVGEVRALASCLVQAPGVVALLGVAGEKAHFVMARSQDLPHDMDAVLKHALAALGSGRGGGRPDFAQGGGVPADIGQVRAALAEAEEYILAAG